MSLNHLITIQHSRELGSGERHGACPLCGESLLTQSADYVERRDDDRIKLEVLKMLVTCRNGHEWRLGHRQLESLANQIAVSAAHQKLTAERLQEVAEQLRGGTCR